MSARVLRFSDYAPKPGEYSLLFSYLPNHGEQTIGVLLLDPGTDTLHIRLRRDWHYVADEEDIEVLAELADDLESLARQNGGAAVLERLENEASQSLRVNDRKAITVRNFESSLQDLYREHVPAKVLQFNTHLPRYSLAVAAGLFLSTRDEVTAEEWIEIPPGLKLDETCSSRAFRGIRWNHRSPMAACVFSAASGRARATRSGCWWRTASLSTTNTQSKDIRAKR